MDKKKRIGIIGLGNMGMGMADNLLKRGFPVTGLDLREERVEAFALLGGIRAESISEVAGSDTVFVMVLNGDQVNKIVCGKDGLLENMKVGSTIIVTATIHPSAMMSLVAPAEEKGVNLIDSPVSGGKSGADQGTLALMAACKTNIFHDQMDVLQAIGKNIFHVGEEIGLGQTTKASLQALIGSTFTAIFESLVLGAKAGVDPEVLYDVIAASGVRSPLFKNSARLILDRRFKDTGSHIDTMYKDLGITMAMAKDNGVAMFTTAAAFELFRAGKSLFPEEDNWCIVKLLEQIAGVEVKGNAKEVVE